MKALGLSVGLASALLVSGCSFTLQKWQFESAVRKAKKGEFRLAVAQMERVVRRDPKKPVALEAARLGARWAQYEARDYQAATRFLNWIILVSPNADERVEAQESLASIYFDKLLDFEQAATELNRLIRLIPKERRPKYQLDLAKANYNLNNIEQALMELKDVMGDDVPKDLRFEALLFRASLFQASKRLDEAIRDFQEILREFPKLALAQNVPMSLAVSLEEKGDFAQAVAVLEKYKDSNQNPQFIEVRIRRLKERQENQPGAGGLRR